MSYDPTLRAVRDSFGLRQLDLADWLDLSRTQYAHIEAGTDPLPAHAWPWLQPWMAALNELEPEPDPPAAPDPAAPLSGPAPLLARLTTCRLEAERLRRLLA